MSQTSPDKPLAAEAPAAAALPVATAVGPVAVGAPLPWYRRCFRWVLISVLGLVAVPLLYLLIALIGMIPVNNGFQPAPDGIEIMVLSNGVHDDLVLPIRSAAMDWTSPFPADHFPGDVSRAEYLVVGWGDKGFYLETPTWADLKASTLVYAVFLPSPTCMHVALWPREAIPRSARRVKISPAQYERLVEHVLSGFRRDERGRIQRIVGAHYGQDDAFYEGRGYYHAFNTCNAWAGRGIKAAGVRVPWFTPLPQSVTRYFPAENPAP
jgi:uncharacterized protein (TIGR02117 family)